MRVRYIMGLQKILVGLVAGIFGDSRYDPDLICDMLFALQCRNSYEESTFALPEIALVRERKGVGRVSRLHSPPRYEIPTFCWEAELLEIRSYRFG